MSVEFMKNIFSPTLASWCVLDSFRPPEPKNVSFVLSRHHVRRVHEKYLLADSSQLMGVRLISASWTQKRLIPTLRTSCTSNSWEIFFSTIRANWWVLDSFSPPEPKNVWFLLSRHDIRRVHEKFFLADTSELWLFYQVRPPGPKNVWFLLYRHVRRIHEKIFSGRFERTDGC